MFLISRSTTTDDRHFRASSLPICKYRFAFAFVFFGLMRFDEKKNKKTPSKTRGVFLFMGVSSQRKMKYNFPFVFCSLQQTKNKCFFF